MTPETSKLVQGLTFNALQAIDHWHKYTRALPDGPSRNLNLQLIRLTRGCVNLIRGWRDDLTRPNGR